jgi:hypothetical protein
MKVRRPSASMCVALAALFLALAGTGYAALKLPKNSVGSKQLRRNSVTTAKIKAGAVTTAKIKAGSINAAKVKSGSLPASVFQPGVLPQQSQPAVETSAYYAFVTGPFSTSSNGGQAIVATVSLPSAGAYTLMADGFAYVSELKGNRDQVFCSLLGPGDVPLAGMPSQLTLGEQGSPLVIVGAANVSQAGTVRMQCSQIADAEADKITYIDSRIVATKVGSLTKG